MTVRLRGAQRHDMSFTPRLDILLPLGSAHVSMKSVKAVNVAQSKAKLRHGELVDGQSPTGN